MIEAKDNKGKTIARVSSKEERDLDYFVMKYMIANGITFADLTVDNRHIMYGIADNQLMKVKA